jgi:hypothetical protein
LFKWRVPNARAVPPSTRLRLRDHRDYFLATGDGGSEFSSDLLLRRAKGRNISERRCRSFCVDSKAYFPHKIEHHWSSVSAAGPAFSAVGARAAARDCRHQLTFNGPAVKAARTGATGLRTAAAADAAREQACDAGGKLETSTNLGSRCRLLLGR